MTSEVADILVAKAPIDSLDPFFKPRGIAILGASDDPERIGGRALRYLKQHFSGSIHPINRSRSTVQGLPALSTIRDIKTPVDLALVCVPAAAVPDSLSDCAAAGIGAAVIVSAGFAETGGEGVELQRRLTAISHETGIRILGPNCLGVMDFKSGALSSFTIVLDFAPPIAGNVAIVSQSGAFAAHAYTLATRRSMGFSKWITTGNECDVDVADCIAYFAADPETSVIMAYMEGCRDGAKLCEALRQAQLARKPVVAIKVGRSEIGARVALSHTAAIAGSDEVFDAVLQRYGVHRATSIEEFIDIAYVASFGRFPERPNVGIVTISGGIGGFMADRCAENDLRLPALPDDVSKELQALLPFASGGNPLDVTAQIINDPGLLEKGLEMILRSGDCDALAIFLTTVLYSEKLRDPVRAVFQRIRQKHPDALIGLCMLTPEHVRGELAALGYIQFDEPVRLIDSIAALNRFRASWAKPPAVHARTHGMELPKLPAKLGERESKEMLAALGFSFAREELARDVEAAVRLAEEFGYPVALKVASSDITHKSEAGGVRLNLADADAVRRAYSEILANVQRYDPRATIDGMLVAEMVTGGAEMILGGRVDEVFGPVVMVGAGGILVEYLKDMVISPAPVSEDEARAMIGRLKSAKILGGVRGGPPLDVDALAMFLKRLSEVIATNEAGVESIEINPAIVRPQGSGCIGVDALIVPR